MRVDFSLFFYLKGQLRRKMNLWSNYTLEPTVVDHSLRFVFMIIECKEFYL